MSIDRRIFLNRAAWAGLAAGAGLVAAPAARAIRIEEGDVAREALVRQACESRRVHDSLMRELVAELEGREGREKAEAQVRQMECPLCGCRLATDTAEE